MTCLLLLCGGITILLATPAEPSPAAATAQQAVWFEDATAACGLDFVHDSGAGKHFYFPEIMGAGGALFDSDGDGDLDLYLVQGRPLAADGDTGADPASPPPNPVYAAGDRLFRNDLVPVREAAPRVGFVDVSEASGIPAGGVGMGVAIGDVDNDGHLDIYVASHGPNRLLRNRGDGRFEDVTMASGADDPRWSVTAAFFDYDGDGWQDLYVANYVDYSPARNIPCFGNTGALDYCGPDSYSPLPDRLFRNLGNGRFEETTGAAGLSGPREASLGVAVVDVDGDGWQDLYVANDRLPNRLWMNQGNGSFRDEALSRGCAVNAEGQPEASMGVAVADVDSDGDEDFFVTHLTRETNTLYANDGSGMFSDRTLMSGLGMASWQMTGFGTAWLDYDNDGAVDLIVVNGAVTTIQDLFQARDPYPFHQPNQLFRQQPGGTFTDVTALSGDVFAISEVSRGAIRGDLDNDGDPDVVITNNNGPTRILLNQGGNRNAWIGVRPVLAAGALAEVEARVRVDANALSRWGRSLRAASYASSIDPRILIGLGSTAGPVSVSLLRPGGERRRWQGLYPDRYWVLPVRGSRP